jgi:hypothetical protein
MQAATDSHCSMKQSAVTCSNIKSKVNQLPIINYPIVMLLQLFVVASLHCSWSGAGRRECVNEEDIALVADFMAMEIWIITGSSIKIVFKPGGGPPC